MSRFGADLWRYRAWNTDVGRAVYWLRRALQPNASYTAKQAARLFYAELVLQNGELSARQKIAEAGAAIPDWLEAT